MDDAELRRDYVRINRLSEGTLVEVGLIEWNGPCHPELRWVPALRVSAQTDDATLETLIGWILEDPDYFAVCDECHDRLPLGHMSGHGICQSCAERNHGVVY